MPDVTIDLDRYLARIGYSGPRVATLDVLHEVQRLHAIGIAFENLDVLLGRPIRTDAASLMRKMVDGGRGGYCYEQNTLLLYALTALGFRAAPLLARVLWQRSPEQPAPRTHMLLRVELDGRRFIADVGFGGSTPTGALGLLPGAEQATPLETFRLLASHGEYELQVRQPVGWAALYHFRPEPVLLVDCDPPNWFHSTCPCSPFLQHLMAARPDVDRRHALRDNVYTVRHLDGRTERRVLRHGSEMLQVLKDVFLVRFSSEADIEVSRRRLHLIAAASRT
jgi:N-hydroxyarylamine O-acetyltransferase